MERIRTVEVLVTLLDPVLVKEQLQAAVDHLAKVKQEVCM